MLGPINKVLLPMKAHYFLFNAGTGPVQPFLSVYARQLGFSSVVIGVIYTILPISGMLAKPVMGIIADRFRCQKAIFLAAQLLVAIAFFSINFSPEVPKSRRVHFACDGDAAFDTSVTKGEQIDDCFVNTINDLTQPVDCQLSCVMQKSDWDVVQKYWNVTQTGPVFSFMAHVNKSKVLAMNNIAFFPFKHVTIDKKQYNASCPCGRDCQISTFCNVDCNTYIINDLAVATDDQVTGYQFWIFLFLMIMGWVSQAIVVSVGDAICFELLEGKHSYYGYQRMFGALGWGIFSVIAGIMVDSLSTNSSTKNYDSAFYLACSFLLLDFLISTRIKNVQTRQSVNILKDVSKLLVEFRILVFLICCIAVGMCTALMWNFLFFLIEDLAKTSGCDSQNWIKTLEGIVMAIETLAGEMPFFFLSGKILKRIGHVHALSLILLVIGLRFIAYSVIPNPWWFLPLELLNGVTFGLFYSCMASYASIVAPKGTEATMQGLVGAVFEGIGVSIGSLIAGILYDEYGGPWTFRLFGIGALIVCLAHAGVQYLIKLRSSKLTDNYTASFQQAYTILEEQSLTLFDP